MTSLLEKSLKRYTAGSIVVFILALPIFYLLTRYFYAEDIEDIIEYHQQTGLLPEIDLDFDITIGLIIQMGLTFIVLAVTLLIMLHFSTRTIWKPFEDTLEKTKHYDLEKDDFTQFMNTDIEEFKELDDTILNSMRHSKKRYLALKEFTENASHELQTPLAILRTNLDLLLQQPLTEEATRYVSEIYDTVTRMGKMNRSLLLLTKIDNEQFKDKNEIFLQDFIKKHIPSYQTLREDIDFVVENRATQSVSVIANEMLLESMLNNLVVNAMRHSPQEGAEISFILDNNTLKISNPSNGTPLDNERIFDRFHTSSEVDLTGDEASEMKQNANKKPVTRKGSGLGLAIVKAICDFHGWSITYSHVDGKHSFIIQW